MKVEQNHIDASQQNTKDIDGYYYTANDGSQMAFWTCYSDRESAEHCHNFDEYMVCISGQYCVTINGTEIVLNPGDELFIPKGQYKAGAALRELGQFMPLAERESNNLLTLYHTLKGALPNDHKDPIPRP